MSVLPNDRQDSKPLRRHPIHESQGIVRLIVTLSEYDLATEQRETALSSQAEIYIIGGLLRRDCPVKVRLFHVPLAVFRYHTERRAFARHIVGDVRRGVDPVGEIVGHRDVHRMRGRNVRRGRAGECRGLEVSRNWQSATCAMEYVRANAGYPCNAAAGGRVLI